MNSPTPEPLPQTPLPSEWNSAIIRQLAYAALALVATIIADVFGLSSTAFLEKGGRVIDSLLSFAVIAVPLWLAYRARKNKPTPPILGTPAIEATIAREEAIAASPGAGAKAQAMKCSLLSVLGAGVLASVVLLSVGCAGSPYRYASTVLDKAHVTLRLFETAQETALPLLQQTAVPESVKAPLRLASRAGTLAAEQLGKAAIEVEQARAAVNAAPDGAARLRLATDRLVEWTQTVKDRIAEIKQATKEVQAL